MVGRRIFLLKWSKIQWTFNIRSFVESVFIRASSYSSTGVSGGHCNYRRSGEMPADFSSLTVAEQQALMDASMSGEVEGSVHVMRQRFLEYPKVLKTCTKFKLGHSTFCWVKPCEVFHRLSAPNSRGEALVVVENLLNQRLSCLNHLPLKKKGPGSRSRVPWQC